MLGWLLCGAWANSRDWLDGADVRPPFKWEMFREESIVLCGMNRKVGDRKSAVESAVEKGFIDAMELRASECETGADE